jgi:hypothetical protein
MKITNEVGRGVRTLRDQVKVINEANRQIMDQLDARIKHLEKTFANEMEELEAVCSFLLWSSVLVGVLCFLFSILGIYVPFKCCLSLSLSSHASQQLTFVYFCFLSFAFSHFLHYVIYIQRTRELIEETVYLAVSELRTSTDSKFAEAQEKLNLISTNVSSITKKQEEMVVGSAGETTRLTNDLSKVEDKLREMFDQGGVMAMIEAGSKPAILALDKKIDAEITGISAAVTSATEIAEAGRKALAEKLKQETDELRRMLEEEVKQDMGELNDGIARLTSSTSDQLAQLHDDLDNQATQLSHQCAFLNESVSGLLLFSSILFFFFQILLTFILLLFFFFFFFFFLCIRYIMLFFLFSFFFFFFTLIIFDIICFE